MRTGLSSSVSFALRQLRFQLKTQSNLVSSGVEVFSIDESRESEFHPLPMRKRMRH